MSCTSPKQVYQHRFNKGKVLFNHTLKYDSNYVPFKIPCKQCLSCRLDYSRQWAMRCMHEAQMQEKAGLTNCFITLTYDNENLPADRSLDHNHFQAFMKRLREHISRKNDGLKIKFYMAGEYGEKYGRPHYHALIFGYDFSDKKQFRKCKRTNTILYTSDELKKIWGKGHISVGAVTFDSAAYVARYVMKKRYGTDVNEHYQYVDPVTFEVFDRKPEYSEPSNGIGKSWFEEYKDETYSSDEVVVKGRSVKPPRYYDFLYELDNPSDFAIIKENRSLAALDSQTKELDSVRAYLSKRNLVAKSNEDIIQERLSAKSDIVQSRCGSFSRKLDFYD